VKKKLIKDEVLQKMYELLQDSELTEEDCIEIGKKINKSAAKRFKDA